MKSVLLLFVGVALATVFSWIAVTFWGYLHVWISPNGWWRHHTRLWTLSLEVLALAPFVTSLALIFARLFKPHTIASASISMALTLVVIYAPTLIQDPQLLIPGVRLGLTFFVPFAVLPPLILLLLRRVRSNKRWKGP